MKILIYLSVFFILFWTFEKWNSKQTPDSAYLMTIGGSNFSSKLLTPHENSSPKTLIYYISPNGNPETFLKTIQPLAEKMNFIAGGSEDFQNGVSPEVFIPAIKKSIDSIIQFTSVKPEKIILCGFGEGGNACFLVSKSFPDTIHAIISCCCTINETNIVPYVVILSGNNDKIVPQDVLRKNRTQLEMSGTKTSLITYKGTHEIPPIEIWEKALKTLLN